MKLTYWVISGLLALPVVPLILAWRKKNRSPSLLILLTADLLYVLCGIFVSKALIGEDYSNRLHVTVFVNLFVVAAAAIFFVIKRQWYALIVSVLLLCDWLYMSIVNAAI